VLVLKWLKCQEGGLNWLVKNLGYLWKLKITFNRINLITKLGCKSYWTIYFQLVKDKVNRLILLNKFCYGIINRLKQKNSRLKY